MIDTIKERYRQLQSSNGSSVLTPVEQTAFNAFNELGIPTVKHEEWRYTRIGSLFNKEYNFAPDKPANSLLQKDLACVRLPGYETANEIVFVNGFFSPTLSTIRSGSLQVLSLEEASKSEYSGIVSEHLGHSNHYVKDGIHALNTAFFTGGHLPSC